MTEFRVLVRTLCLLATVICPGLAAVADTIEARQIQNGGAPSTTNFVNRAYHASSALGGYLYIDGGEISFYDDSGVIQRLPDNNTYAIDLSQSWDNQTVVFHTITKTAPVMNNGHLWANRVGGELYAFGGEQSQALPSDQLPSVPATSFWRFLPSDQSGLWTEVTDSQNFAGIKRPSGGAATAGGSEGFLLGGYSSSHTSSETADVVGYEPTPGMLVYNFTSNSWQNNSALDYSQYGTAEYGQAHFVAGFNGNHGLVAALGGETSSVTEWTDNGMNLLTFRTINLYDPVANKWYHQDASGEIPEARNRFCSIGLSGDENTYEIYIFGGHVSSVTGEPQASDTEAQVALNTARDEVFVLTIPGFNWQKAKYPPTWPRVDHTCNVVGGQMVVIGGLNPAVNGSDFYSTPDPWANGVGVFDLTNMEWSDSYTSNPAKYVTPQVVKDWYTRNGGPFPKEWSDEALQTYFTGNESSSGSSPSGSSPSPSSTAVSGKSGSSNNAGVIAGSVVSGVVGACLLTALVWCLLRRRKQKRSPDVYSLHSQDGRHSQEDRDTIVPNEYSTYSGKTITSEIIEEKAPTELPQTTRYSELSPLGDGLQSPPPLYSPVREGERKPLTMATATGFPVVEAPVGMGRVEMEG